MSNQQQTIPENTIPQLKGDAIMTIQIGGSFVGKLQNTLFYLIEGKDAEVKALEEKKGQVELTPWENSVVTITMLLQDILRNATENNFIEYIPIETILPKNPVEDSNQ